MDDNFDPGHPLYQEMARLAAITRRHPTLRDGAQQHRYSSSAPGIYAFSRVGEREYVVALNNAEQAASAAVPTFMARGEWEKVYGDGAGAAAQRLRQAAERDRGTAVGRRLPREGPPPAQQAGTGRVTRRARHGP